MSDLPVDDFLGDVEGNGHVPGFFDSVEFSDDEVNLDEPLPEPPPVDSEPIVGDGSCVVCGAPTFRPPGLTKAGRKKRVPKHCDLHKPNLRVPPERPDVTRLESKSLENIAEELADDLMLLAMMVGTFAPVTGMYLQQRADPFTTAIVKLAAKNQRILRVLHRAAQVAPVYTVAETLAGTAYAVQVDMNGKDPHNTIGHRLKVDKAYDAIHGEPDFPDQQGFTGPPRYSHVASVQ